MQSTLSSRFFGSILLIASCCIGAGMLGLPILSAQAGFLPSSLMFLVSWAFMATTGLLLLEVTLWFKDDVNIISMATRTLGWLGQFIAWGGFLFLFYTLMVAYIAGTGAIVNDAFSQWIGFKIPLWASCLAITLLLGMLIYLGTAVVDQSNRWLMIGLLLTYCVMIVFGLKHIRTDYLTHMKWSAATWALPAMIISFGYHNLIPSIATYLERNHNALRMAVLIGSAIPLIVYLLWQLLILGVLPPEEESLKAILERGEIATQALRRASSASWIIAWGEAFAFFAIITSFLGVALSFVDFLKDGLKLPQIQQGRFLATLCVIIPPFLCAIVYPTAFLTALNYAGSFGAVTLFGILPAAMVWKGRYLQKIQGEQFVPGGKFVLILVILFALAVMALQLVDSLDGVP